jgi:hypothetical protein
MKDFIKIYIQDHREAFDEGIPGGHVWKNIRYALDKPSGKDNLEAFLEANRETLDSETPSLDVWGRIGSALPASNHAPKRVVMSWKQSIGRIAASIALLLSGIGIGLWYAHQGEKAEAGMAMSEVSHEYAELEQYYQRDISVKQVRLSSFSGSQPAEVHADMEQMDNVMSDLRKELAQVPPGNREQVVRAMIENYKAKAAILQKVLDHLDESQTGTNNSGKKHEIKSL